MKYRNEIIQFIFVLAIGFGVVAMCKGLEKYSMKLSKGNDRDIRLLYKQVSANPRR